MKQKIKTILYSFSLIIAYPFYLISPFMKAFGLVIRSVYSQYLRLQLKASGLDVAFSIPVRVIGSKYISCGNHNYFGANGILSAWAVESVNRPPQIIIKDNVTIGPGFHISAINKIQIGNGVLMGKYVSIVDNSHGHIVLKESEQPPIKREIIPLGEVIIEDNVWIGDKVTIAKGVKIGKSAIVGSNSVVTSDVPAYAVVAGAPARILRIINK